MSTTSIEERIELLLRKAESTDSEHEREALTSAAQKLMLKYGIEMAQLDLDPKHRNEDKVVVTEFTRTGIYANAEMSVVGAITRALGIRSFYVKHTKSKYVVSVIDFESTSRVHVRLIQSLLRQGETSMMRWWKEVGRTMYIASEGFIARRSFLTAFAAGAVDRLAEERKEAVDGVSGAGELVLVRSQKLDDEFNGYGVKKAVSRRKGYGLASAAGYVEGEKADTSMIAGDLSR